MIYFYIPQKKMPNRIPTDPLEFWEGYKYGIYCWTILTYLNLKSTGYEVSLTTEIPEKGIIISHRGLLDDHLKPNNHQLFICIRADYSRHPYAQLHVYQNPTGIQGLKKDAIFHQTDRMFSFTNDFYLPHWPQPGLVKRSSHRGKAFKNIVYMGREENLSVFLKTEDLEAAMASNGYKFQIKESPKEWADYSNVDAVIAIRSFQDSKYPYKPPTKLYNAWQAEVPFLCSPNESAFQILKKNQYDFIEVENINEIIQKLNYLRTEKDFREKVVQQGKNRAREFSFTSITKKWKNYLNQIALKKFTHWMNATSTEKNIFLTQRLFIKNTARIIHKCRK